MENKLKQAGIIFEKANESLEKKYKGKILAIDTDTGDYFVGDSALDAYQKAIQKHPNKKFVFKRIGFPSTYVVGAQT